MIFNIVGNIVKCTMNQLWVQAQKRKAILEDIDPVDTCVTVFHWIPLLVGIGNREFMNCWMLTVFKRGVGGKVMR
jgi:hypothetical protein